MGKGLAEGLSRLRRKRKEMFPPDLGIATCRLQAKPKLATCGIGEQVLLRSHLSFESNNE
jgi:hypothetical protein